MKIEINMIPNANRTRIGDSTVLKQCEAICSKNHGSNGGTLRLGFIDVIFCSDYLTIAKETNTQDVVGYAGLQFKDEKWSVYQVAIDPKYQGCGIGTAIYDYIFQHLKGINKLHVHIAKENTVSLALHEKFGFTGYEDDHTFPAFERIVGDEAIYTMCEAQPQEYDVRSPVINKVHELYPMYV
ncbi:MAG: GNAT family N-acetyltransferase [Firmicutes bacterium]|nr:GNAT family N-acetyltransferase [Bacillota bacterium]